MAVNEKRSQCTTSSEPPKDPVVGLFADIDAALALLRKAMLAAHPDVDDDSAWQAACFTKDHSFIKAGSVVIAIDNLRCAIEGYQSLSAKTRSSSQQH